MRPETLERLLTDRSLGGLDSDSAELLDAWLADHRDAAVQAAQLDSVVADATTVLSAGQTTVHADDLPPLRIALATTSSGAASPAHQPTGRSVRVTWQAGLAMAACLLIGAISGRALPGTAPTQPDEPEFVQVVVTPVTHGDSLFVKTASAEVRDDSGFWSRERFEREFRRRAAESRNFAPLPQPEWLSKYRAYGAS